MGRPTNKQRLNDAYREQELSISTASSSGDTSTSGKASRSHHSSRAKSTSERSIKTRQNLDGSGDPEASGTRSPTGSRTPEGAQSSGSRSPTGTSSSRGQSMSASRTQIVNKNIDVGTRGRMIWSGNNIPKELASRPAPSTLGQPIKVALNSHAVDIKTLLNSTVYQYDVIIGNGEEKRGLIKKVWASKAVRDALGNGFIFDGNKLAWSMKKHEREFKILVDIDAEEKRPAPKSGKENKHRVVIRCTKEVPFTALSAYLAGKTDFNHNILETINFLDHVLRETPSSKFTAIKRSFFARGQERYSLGNGVEAFKGVFTSMRIVHGKPHGLAINIDVSNGTFWTAAPLHLAAKELAGRRDVNDLIVSLQRGESSAAGKILKKLRKIHVTAKHRQGQEDSYCIDKLVYKSAKDHKFEKDGKMISIYDYFAKEFNRRLQYPDLPLCKMTRGLNTMLPMEVLMIDENQRYVTKLDEKQTSNMIKFAVEPPEGRLKSIKQGQNMLAWGSDPVLNHFGIKVDPTMTTVDAKLIMAPKVQYGQGEAKPGTSGRWDLKGKKFLNPNTAPLKSWAVCVISGRRGGKPDKSVIQNFISEFVKIYKGHGGRVENAQPAMALASGDDVSAWVTDTWNKAGSQSNMRPQILVFILPDKDSQVYGRIKRSADCRYGVVSQCMQYMHVQKGQAQYISNVCMKFNAKLGGNTCRAIGPKSGGKTGIFSTPTCIIGADVSHAAPGSQAASMAALTMSADPFGVTYIGNAETNGYRVEMITTDNINNMIKPMLQNWMKVVGNGALPKRIIYLRDGVSEGQYQQVIDQEVGDLKKLIRTANPSADIPVVAIVGGKRHHVRFFPQKGDRNGNALPGTLVETGVTHPFENDFYLCSHAAIKGTARPMHYHVLLNDAKMPNEEIQTLIYEQCYQYMRATTPVSQHPAIYYAHIISNRAIPHDPAWSGSSDATPSTQAGGSQGAGTDTSPNSTTPFARLMPMPNQGGINQTMWYI